MPEYLDDPSSLTKDKLKNELLAHNVELPSGNPTKDVYVQLYLKNLTPQNKQRVTAATLDAFSSDEELPTPVVSNRSRSSGRKATRKTDKTLPDELDVTLLSDGGLRDELLKHGVDVGPIVASTRKLYEKKLQKLLDDGPAQPAATQLVITEIQVNHNGNSESDLYSDKEDEVTPEPEPEPVAEPEPVPVVERLVRSRGKTPVTTRTRSSQHNKRDQLMDEEDHNEDQVLNVKRKSKRLSHRMLHEEDTGLHLPKSNKGSSLRPLALLNSALLEDPEPAVGQSFTALTPAVRSAFYKSKSLPEEHSPQPAAKVHPVTFSPMCNISPIKKQESQWCVTEQIGCEAGGGSAAGEESVPADILPNKRRQQKISSFLSTRSAVKTNSSTSTVSKQLMVEKIAASDQTPKAEESDVLKELFTNDISSPTGINATCRRPIRGAAGRPLKSSDLWNDENSYFSPKTTRTSSNSCTYTENRTVRVSSLPLSSAPPSSSSTTSSSVSSYSTSSRLLSAAPPAGQSKAARRGMSLWIKLFLLAIVAAFLFLVYQAMETNTNSPFEGQGTEVSAGSTA